jgi:hypothetical protein
MKFQNVIKNNVFFGSFRPKITQKKNLDIKSQFWMSIDCSIRFKVSVPNGIFGTFNFKAKCFSNKGLN